jgi:xanthine dehydrogenase YagR molybdenum-binding subunit
MSQNQASGRAKIEAVPEPGSIVHIKMPMVRDYSTGGGHLPGDELVEGDDRIVTKKWQGYAPQNLNVVGHSMPPLPEVSIPRFTGKAEYASRVWFPNLLYAKFLTCPHPRARIRRLDTSKAEHMPGVAYVLTYRNSPTSSPLPQELSLTGEVVAIVAADTEDLAEDAVEAIEVEYEVLPAAPTLESAMAPNAPDLRPGMRGNLIRISPDDPHYDANATWTAKRGDIEQGFREADVVREFTYYWAAATAIPIQPAGSVARWDGDQLTFWGMGQGIYPLRDSLARQLGIDPAKVRFINKYNGCTFSAARGATEPFYVYIAHIAKTTGRPTKVMLTKQQEMAFVYVKPENMTKFKVGAKDGKIIALQHEVYISAGDLGQIGQAENEIAKNNFELYTSEVPHWKSTAYAYQSNAMRTSPVRSYTQQEIKWAFENMIDEMAEAVRMDPVQFRLRHVSRPGNKLTAEWHKDLGPGARYENQNGAVTYDSFASAEVLQEGAKAIGWERRNPVAGAGTGRFRRGIGVAMSQHHAGHMGYHDGEEGFRRRMVETGGTGGGGGGGLFGAEVEVTADGYVTMKNALPDSGTNHGTALAQVVAEILGFTTRNYIRPLWGDSAITPPSNGWIAGKTITVQGAALYSAADKLRKDLLSRAARALNVDVTTLQIRDGVISSTADPRKRTTFGSLVRANRGPITQRGQGVNKNQGRALTKGVGACFLEVEVDMWTGNFRLLRAAYCHDTGLAVNPMVASADMHGSLAESIQMAIDPVPYDREFPGHRHYSVGYLSYRLPTIMDVAEHQTQVLVDSLEPRWFFGIKSFSETSIGSVPGALSNAIYNACGVRIRETPITREKIMAGLKGRSI